MTSSDCYAPTAMAHQDPARKEFRTGDPWVVFSYLVAGVGFYGLLGVLADLWLGTSFLVAVGILLGAGLGVYMTWSRFRVGPGPADTEALKKNVTTQEFE